MRNNQMMTWLLGAGAVAIAVAGWVIPRRNTPTRRMMRWTRNSTEMIGGMIAPATRIVMRVMKGMAR
ncbi:hypothetical protein [Ammoniphilus sp. 3BR4]|uniref:hypothetical protein n=1 Tax=Ammoniphilus sp. 3BR4 TaxID=3158265 RepID=UPI003467231B